MKLESQAVADRPGVAEHEHLQQNWVLLLAMGGALVLLGAAIIGEPEMTFIATNVMVQVLGVMMVIGGILQFAAAFWGRRWRGFILHLLAGVFYLIAGVFMIGKTDEAAVAFTLVIACVLLVGGISRIVLSAVLRFAGWGWVLLNGIISVILGAAIWRHLPDAGEWVIGLFVGIEMIFGGMSLVMLALRARAEPKGPLAT